jgi:hypothetical protein
MTPSPKIPRPSLPALALAGALAAVAATAPSEAAAVADPAGDFLSTYTGPQNGDMDVISVNALDQGGNVTLSAMLNGAVGTTSTGVYVWGVNRGAGQQFLLTGTPPVGAGVFFDAVVILFPNQTGRVVDITGGGTTTNLAAGAVTVSGNGITGVVPLSLLPTTGFANPADYVYNLWPRSGLTSNVQIADFAPNASSFAASVPEPGAWAMMIVGFGLLGAMGRRRRRAATA